MSNRAPVRDATNTEGFGPLARGGLATRRRRLATGRLSDWTTGTAAEPCRHFDSLRVRSRRTVRSVRSTADPGGSPRPVAAAATSFAGPHSAARLGGDSRHPAH